MAPVALVNTTIMNGRRDFLTVHLPVGFTASEVQIREGREDDAGSAGGLQNWGTWRSLRIGLDAALDCAVKTEKADGKKWR